MSLEALTQLYLDFMKNVGSSDSKASYVDLISVLFSVDVQKIVNGKLLLQGHATLLEQLSVARGFAFPWTMSALDILTDNLKKLHRCTFWMGFKAAKCTYYHGYFKF